MTLDTETIDGSEAPAGNRSRLDQLKAAFAERTEEKRLYKRLPKPSSVPLVAEYRVLPSKDAQDALRRDSELEANEDLLIRALVSLHVHDPAHPAADKRGLVELQRWLEIDAGGPLRFDRRFTDLVGIDPGTAREVCLAVFDGNEIALGAQAAQVMAWMTDTTAEALQDFTTGS